VGGDDGRAQARAALQPGGAAGALAGENGAGKTTLVKLLTGMYQPTSGRIRLDGTPLTEIDPSAWRERTAATFQDFVEFELVALEVVGIADLGRIDDAGAVAHSGGQWQRLALARRMMRLAPLLLRITEHGTHQQLMANRGLYSQLYEM
jgi:ATP-binding cassette subfamily B protein